MNTVKGANGELFLADSISNPEKKVKENSDIKKQERAIDEDPYSYRSLVSKSDMKVTVIDDTIHYQPDKQTRKDVVDQALKNVAYVGKRNEDGSVLVHVKDLDSDVLVGRNGLKHGLDRRMTQNAAITLNAGEILSNSIRINELIPDKENVSNSYILIGAAKNSRNEVFVVEFLVNRYTNEVTSIDVLYSANAKKESVALNAPEITEGPLLATDSTISISKLLDSVNRYFPDILPEDVLRHYGHSFRPDGKLGESVLYQERSLHQSSRNALIRFGEDAKNTKVRNGLVGEYTKRLEELDKKVLKLEEAESKLSLAVDSGNKEEEALYQKRVDALSKELRTIQRDLEAMENSKELQAIVRREKEATRRQVEILSYQLLFFVCQYVSSNLALRGCQAWAECFDYGSDHSFCFEIKF